MLTGIFSYQASFLNPLLKLAVFLLFAIGTWYFWWARAAYGGNLKRIAGALMWGGIAGCIGAGARFLGDYVVEFKWLESTGAIIFALVSLLVAWLVCTNLNEIAEAFGLAGGK